MKSGISALSSYGATTEIDSIDAYFRKTAPRPPAGAPVPPGGEWLVFPDPAFEGPAFEG